MGFKGVCLMLCLALFAMEAHGLKQFVAYRRNLDFFVAIQACRVMGGHLASVESEAEHNAVLAAINVAVGTAPTAWWIGGSDYGWEGKFSWYGLNKQLVYKNFAPGEPSNSHGYENCILIDPNKGNKWNDAPCDAAVEGFICAYVR